MNGLFLPTAKHRLDFLSARHTELDLSKKELRAAYRGLVKRKSPDERYNLALAFLNGQLLDLAKKSV